MKQQRTERKQQLQNKTIFMQLLEFVLQGLLCKSCMTFSQQKQGTRRTKQYGRSNAVSREHSLSLTAPFPYAASLRFTSSFNCSGRG
jgi:hypothetical protein